MAASGAAAAINNGTPVSSPTISSISPSSYPADNSNHSMTINGSGFQNGASLLFHDPQGNPYNSNPSKLTYVNSGQIIYQFNDASDAGTWNVAVYNPDGGHSAAANFQVGTSSPTISSISPSSYPSDNSDHAMTIFGSGFQNGASLVFHDPQGRTYNSNSSKLTYVNSGQINYQFNDGSDAGTWNVAVYNPDGGHSAAANFQVNASSPTISSISPSTYPSDNSDHAMTIFGSGFQNGASLVFHDPQGHTYNSNSSKLTFVNSGQINYQFNDASDPGTWNVAVYNPDGGHSAAANFQVNTSSPSISNISPSTYPSDNSDHAMTINGSGFQNGASLTFHDPQGNPYNSNPSKLTFVNSGQINYQFNDASDPGTWNVAVNNPDGGHSGAASFQVMAVSLPTISSISPSSYPSDNSDHAMTIFGANFQNGASLTFHDPQGNPYNSNSSKLTYVNSGQINYQFNDGTDPGTWNVAVNNPDGGHSAPTDFQVAQSTTPTITSVIPNPVIGCDCKQPIKVMGTNFVSKPTLTLTWTGQTNYTVPANQVTFVSSTEVDMSINVTTQPDSWTVQATNPDGQKSNIEPFQVVAPTTPILSVNPPSAPVGPTSGSTSFTVTNTGGGSMSYSSAIKFGASWLSIVSGGSGGNTGVINVAFTQNTGDQRKAAIVVSANASNSPVTVSVVQGAASGGQIFGWPVDSHNAVSNGYDTQDQFDGVNKYHTGLDITSSTSSLKILAAADGYVRTVPLHTYRNDNHCMGNVIVIDHNNGQGPFSLYAHLAKILVTDKSFVTKGTYIAVMGNTGTATKTNTCIPIGVHLHFELKQRNALGNLDDNFGPAWGYTPPTPPGGPDVHPSLYGFMDPMPYLEYNVSNYSSPISVVASSNQAVSTAPDSNGTTTTFAQVSSGQKFSAFASANGWYEVFLASGYSGTNDGGPASGWIQATPISGDPLLSISNPNEGIVGVNVRNGPTTAGTAVVSIAWDKQWFVQLATAAAGHGCTTNGVPSPWYQIALASNSSAPTGWICGRFVVPGGKAPHSQGTVARAEQKSAIKSIAPVVVARNDGPSDHSTDPRQKRSSVLQWPVQTESNFRVIEPYQTYLRTGHAGPRYSTGISISSAAGGPVLAAAEGSLVAFIRGDAGKDHGYGNVAILSHAGGLYTLYGGLGNLEPELRDRISARCKSSDQVAFKCDPGSISVASGQQLGSVGDVVFDKGHATGVHFEVRTFAGLSAPSVHPPEYGYASVIPDTLGYRDPIEYLEGAVPLKHPTRAAFTADGYGTLLRIGPNGQYAALRALRDHEELWARMTAPPTSDCSMGWYEVYRGSADDPMYPPSTPLAYFTGPAGQLPTAWVCRGNGNEHWVNATGIH